MFRDVCRHPDTRDQNHATDDLRVTKIGTDCAEYIHSLQSHLAERWRQALEQQALADSRAKDLREKARLAQEQQALADSQARDLMQRALLAKDESPPATAPCKNEEPEET
jgi:hypothetical protein